METPAWLALIAQLISSRATSSGAPAEPNPFIHRNTAPSRCSEPPAHRRARRTGPRRRSPIRAVRPQQPGRTGRRGPQVPDRPGRERHIEPGGAQALERGDRVGREDGGAAAAERARDLGVRADDGDAAQPGA